MSDAAPRRLLVVNPNTTASVTDTFVAAARAVAPDGVTVEGVTGAFGAGIVSIEAENVVAAHSALELLAANVARCDAAILAISFDSGLRAAEEIMPVPVVGMTHSALLSAARQGGPIGVVIFGAMSLSLYRSLFRLYGMDARIAAVEVVEIGDASGYLDTPALDARVVEAVARLCRGHAVGAVAICGAAVVGMARRLQPSVPVPLVDGAEPSVSAALDAIARSPRRPERVRPLSRSTGISAELAALIAGAPPPAAMP